MADLSTVLAKLERAREHAVALDAALDEWVQGNNFELKHDFQTNTGWNELRLALKHEAPNTRLALILGDVMTNARGALDYLVWQLVSQGGTTRPTDRTMFPVVRDRTNWKSAVGDRLKGVDARWIAEIEALQPYHESGPEMHYLSVLDDMNNLNKHRTIPATLHQVHKMEMNLQTVPGMSYQFENPQPLAVDGAILFRVRREDSAKLTLPSVSLLWRVGFDDGTDRQWDSRDLLEWLEAAIKRFALAFEGPA